MLSPAFSVNSSSTHTQLWMKLGVSHGIKDIPHRSRWSVWHHSAVNKNDIVPGWTSLQLCNFSDNKVRLVLSGGMRLRGQLKTIDYCIAEGEFANFVCRIVVCCQSFSEWNASGCLKVEIIQGTCPSWTWSRECLDWHFQNVSIWPHGDTHDKNERWPRTTLQLVQIL